LGSAENSPDGRPVANQLKRIDFSDPSHILEDYYQDGWPEVDGPSPAVVYQLAAHMEVPKGGRVASRIHSWAAAGERDRVDLAAVQNIHVTVPQDGEIVVTIHELKRSCGPESLADTLVALRAEWTAQRGAWLVGKAMVPRVTVSLPLDATLEAVEPIRAVCQAAGCGPFGEGANLPTGGVRRFESGGYHGVVLEPVGAAPIFLVAPKAFSLASEATAREGTLTLPVATTANELRIWYAWDPARPALLTLRNHDYEEQTNDLSRGRVIWVTFDRHEFDAALYQVPREAGTGTDEASLAAVIARAQAWWDTADERARWDQSRVLVPDSGYYAGKSLDASASDIVWGEPNASGLRLGLGGLMPGASVPTGQPLPLKQFIHNDGTKTIQLSATGPFNEGIEGTLVRADGARIPHIATYRWPMVAIRARLEPGQFIELQSRPLQTVYANPDGSASGALLGYDSGFIAKPGDYVLELVHHIGRFHGAPANTFTGNPSIAPGLGEWTGTLHAAALPVRLTEPAIGTARPGDVREDRRLDRIQFKPDRIVLSRPAPGMTGSHSFVVDAAGHWPTLVGEWLVARPDLGYLAAWDEGNRRLWYVNGPTVQKLDFSGSALRDAGSWPATTPTDGYGDMPPGVRAAFGLPRAKHPSITPEAHTPPAPKMVKIKSTQLALGPPREDGLRVAWVLSPQRQEYAIGEIVKCAVWFYNDGPAAITFSTDAWRQLDTWKATRADWSPIEVRTTWFTGITPQETITLQPGESREVPAHGVGIGNAEFAERYGRAELGAELWADPGDEVTCVWEVAVSPSGTERLTTGPVTFRVTPAPPEGPRPPIVTDRLGSYNLGHGAILNLSQIGSAEGYTNYAWITWEKARGATADGKADIAMPRSADPKDFSLPTFVLSRSVHALWIVESKRIRMIDFSTLGEAKESAWPRADAPADFGGAPEDVREAIRKVAPRIDERNGSAPGPTPHTAVSGSAIADVLDRDGAIRLASATVLKFLRTEELDVRLSLLDLPDEGREELEQFFQRHPLPAEPNAVPGGFSESDKGLMMANRLPDGSWFAKILVYLPVSARAHAFLVNIRSGVARIDWNLSTVHQAGVYEDLWEGAPGNAAVLYAKVRRGDYFNFAFDAERFSCYELTSFLVDRRFFGYVEKGSTLEGTLNGLIDHGFSRVRVMVPTGPRDQRQLVVRDAARGHHAEAEQSNPTADREAEPDASTAPTAAFSIRLVSDTAGPNTERLPEKAATGVDATFLNIEKPIVITSADVASAAPEEPETGDSRWSIRVELKPEAGRRFEAFTAQHVGRRLAIVVDGVVLMAPTVRDRIGRSIAISGNFTEQEARSVVQAVKPSP
ncbi:MAG: SecDF P1 head subdomain-containing protein, partial [Verrucomicrobiales bacterium]